MAPHLQLDGVNRLVSPPLARDDGQGQLREPVVGWKGGRTSGSFLDRRGDLKGFRTVRCLDHDIDASKRRVVERGKHAEPAPLPGAEMGDVCEQDLAYCGDREQQRRNRCRPARRSRCESAPLSGEQRPDIQFRRADSTLDRTGCTRRHRPGPPSSRREASGQEAADRLFLRGQTLPCWSSLDCLGWDTNVRPTPQQRGRPGSRVGGFGSKDLKPYAFAQQALLRAINFRSKQADQE